MKQVPIFPRDKLSRKTKDIKEEDKVKFIKQLLAHSRDRLSRKAKNIKKVLEDEVDFIKQVPYIQEIG